MPKYTFKCSKCGSSEQKYVSSSTKEYPCSECFHRGSDNIMMKRQMPTLNGPSTVTEVVDKHVNRVWQDGQQESIKARRDKYYWSVEVPRMVNSGIYSIETMLENQWVYFNEKEEICIYNKPPHER